MQFPVARVEGFAGELEDLGLDAKLGVAYAEEQVVVSGADSGYIVDVADSVRQIRADAVQLLLDLQDALRVSSSELLMVCRMLDDVDQAVREQFDALVPADAYPVPPQDLAAVSVDDVDDGIDEEVEPGVGGIVVGPASAYLNDPVAADAAYSDWQQVVDVTDLLSPSTYILKGLELVLGYNPIHELAEWMTGDWEAVSKAGSAMVQLAEYADICSLNLWASCEAVFGPTVGAPAGWTGNAATAARNCFVALQVAIHDANPACGNLGSALQDAASGMYHLAESLSDLLEAFLDKLIDIGVHALAGAALSETIIGGLFFGGWAVLDVKKAADIYDDIRDIEAGVKGIVEAVAGIVLANSPTAVPLPTLPAPYHQPSTPPLVGTLPVTS